VLYSVLRINK